MNKLFLKLICAGFLQDCFLNVILNLFQDLATVAQGKAPLPSLRDTLSPRGRGVPKARHQTIFVCLFMSLRGATHVAMLTILVIFSLSLRGAKGTIQCKTIFVRLFMSLRGRAKRGRGNRKVVKYVIARLS